MSRLRPLTQTAALLLVIPAPPPSQAAAVSGRRPSDSWFRPQLHPPVARLLTFLSQSRLCLALHKSL
jgi:hypothetical protein